MGRHGIDGNFRFGIRQAANGPRRGERRPSRAFPRSINTRSQSRSRTAWTASSPFTTLCTCGRKVRACPSRLPGSPGCRPPPGSAVPRNSPEEASASRAAGRSNARSVTVPNRLLQFLRLHGLGEYLLDIQGFALGNQIRPARRERGKSDPPDQRSRRKCSTVILSSIGWERTLKSTSRIERRSARADPAPSRREHHPPAPDNPGVRKSRPGFPDDPRRPGSAGRRRTAAGRGASGDRPAPRECPRKTRCPLPSRLSTRMLPSINWINCEQIANPNPVPPNRRVTELSVWWNASKIHCCLSAGNADPRILHGNPQLGFVSGILDRDGMQRRLRLPP